MILGWLPIGAFIASYGLTAWLLRHSRMSQVVDRPNSRSSHSVPTPRGGGLSMVAVMTCGIIILYFTESVTLPLAAVAIWGGLGVAAVGFWDDVRSAPIALRISVHIGAAIFAVYCLGGTQAIHVGAYVLVPGVMGAAIAVLAVVWILNLFNFMDGIDGIAASEAAFILLGAAGLGLSVGHTSPADVAPMLILGAACLGFLMWNWSPAAIFMGDVGSGYLGFLIAVFALESSRTSAINIFVWLILGGVFLVDATLTLLRRLFRRERVYQAHRTHAYQWLARRWRSHAAVAVSVLVIDIVWLLPSAALAVAYPAFSPWICILALAPLAVGAFIAGAGRPE